MDLVHGVRAPHVGARYRRGDVRAGRLLLGARLPRQAHEDTRRRLLRACSGTGETYSSYKQ